MIRHLLLASWTLAAAAARAAEPAADSATYHLIDRSGAVLASLDAEAASAFREGLSRVKIGGRWGFVGPDGATVIPPSLSQVSDFHEGRAAAEKDGLWGFIDPSGAWAVPARYQAARELSGGLAL